MQFPSVLYLLVINFYVYCNGQRLRDSIYKPIWAGAPCFRRMNGTHQIGCSSERGGTVGVLHAVSTNEDMSWLLKSAAAGPYSIILPMHLFNRDFVDPLIVRPDLIAGIIVVNNGTNKPETFSHDQRCPNHQSQWYAKESCQNSNADQNVWNPFGTGLMYEDYPFPIFYLPADRLTDIQSLYECFNKFNNYELDQQSSRSLCAIEMDSFMFAAFNSKICIKRSQAVLNRNLTPIRLCDPLSDRSIFSTLFSRITDNGEKSKLDKKNVSESKGSVALVTAPMHATSMFEGLGTGAVTTFSGLVTLLATARALNLMFSKEDKVYDKNVMFVALNLEAYDYIGSQKMASDLSSKKYPYESSDPIPHLDPMSIGPHIHLGQFNRDSKLLHAFTPNYNETDRNKMATDFIASFPTDSDTPIIRSNNLPPSSVHAFLNFLNSSITQMSSIVLADHSQNFENKYYQSILDVKDNLNYSYLNISSKTNEFTLNDTKVPDSFVPMESVQMRLANLSTSLAKSLYKHVTDKEYNGPIRASPFIIDELLFCFTESVACPLFIASQSSNPIMNTVMYPASRYVGSSIWYTAVTHMTGQLAVLLSGKEMPRVKADCKTLENETLHYEWLSGWNKSGFCVQSNVNFTLAMSPAFIEEDYDFTSTKYSAWTESVWSSMSIRIFLRPAAWRGKVLLGTGCIIFVISFLFVYFGRRHIIWLMEFVASEDNSDASPQSQSRVDC